jgi:manganese/zinc/iron transport system permease protein
MLPLTYNTLIVLLGTSLLGASAGLIGGFAVLRRRALIGDALSHAAFPGICLSFIFWGQRSLPIMLLGALVSGLLGVAVVSLLRGSTRIKEDAGIGIVASVFFGAGIVLSRWIQNESTGGSRAGIDSYILGKTAGMIAQDVYLIAGVATFCLLAVLLLYKEFKLVIFDPSFARVQGWPATVLDIFLMGLIAVTVVIGLPAVGVVLMAAMLILPSAAARFWTDQLGLLLLLSAGFGLATGAVGTLLSAQFSLSPAGPVIVLFGSGLFLCSVCFAPHRGAVARLVAHIRFRNQLGEQKLLRRLYELAEDAPPDAAFPWEAIGTGRESLAAGTRLLRDRLLQSGLITQPAVGKFRLSPSGARRAAAMLRGHRLWVLFLTEHPDLAANYTDMDAETVDQFLTPEMIAELTAQLKRTHRWPKSFDQQEAAG